MMDAAPLRYIVVRSVSYPRHRAVWDRMWQVSTATSAAVSVRSRLAPSVIGWKPDSIAALISSGEKSPSGPINIVADLPAMYRQASS